MSSDILGNTWSVSATGLEIITQNNTIRDKSSILKNALDADLKEIGSPILAKEISKGHLSQIVLQIQKIRNISAPKANENSQAAPRMLKLVLTDGDSYIQAIEIAPIAAINRETTPPGTKLLIKSAKIASSYLLLDAQSCSVLGGKVASLYEKWEINKNVHSYTRQTSTSDGPPAWVNFGSKISSNVPDNRPFKSLENKDSKENSEFELQRQGAIAEATAGAVKKVFGGGTKQNPAPQHPQVYKKPAFEPRDKKNQRSNKSLAKDVDEEKPQKPSERISLFDFLEDKLPEEPKAVQNSKQSFNQPRNQSVNSYNYSNNSAPQPNKKYENNYSNNSANNSRPQQNKKYENSYNYSNNSRPQQNKKYENQRSRNNNQQEVADLGNNLEKMSLNSQFASRSLRQHLNLGAQSSQKRDDYNHSRDQGNNSWKVGDECLAKYWEDGKFYNANITAITEKTCVVQFKGYGNIEEVLKHDCLPAARGENRKQHTGSMEFRRSAKSYNNKRQ